MMIKVIEILKYLWQLPQNVVAIFYYLYLIGQESLITVGKYKDTMVYTRNGYGSVTLGNYIFLSPIAPESTLLHEYGHTRQSLRLGPLYLIIIGIPSILWAATHKWIAPNKSYYDFYTEKWANKLAMMN
jgi:hypothetical protein